MSGALGHPAPRRSSSSLTPRRSSSVKRSSAPPSENGAAAANGKPSSPNSSVVVERTVKKLRLSKALTILEGISVSEACKRMAIRLVDAVLLTDANALLSGIVTDKDIISRVLAEELKPEQTTISEVMTRNPIFVNSDSLAIDALQKMVQGKFRHLPVVENAEVIAMLDITKCLYDAISRMEKAAEQGSAIAAAVEGVERQFGSNLSGFLSVSRENLRAMRIKEASSAFIETLRERMFKPSLSSFISENSSVAVVEPSDSVQVAAKRMRDLRVNSVLIMSENNILGILTSKDILLRVLAQDLPPDLTLVEKVMTANPECVTLETTILEALHIMHDGKFLNLPVVDKDGNVAACLDVLQITHAAISMAESGNGTVNDVANTVMQNFWDSAFNMESPDDYETQSERSMSQYVASEGAEHAKPAYPSLGLGNSISFKFKDLKGRVHRFKSGTENLAELVSAVMQRVGASNDQNHLQLTYEDDEGDKVLLTADGDLTSAVTNARAAGLKVLRLHLDYTVTDKSQDIRKPLPDTVTAEKAETASLRYGLLAGAAVLTSIGVLVYLKRSNI